MVRNKRTLCFLANTLQSKMTSPLRLTIVDPLHARSLARQYLYDAVISIDSPQPHLPSAPCDGRRKFFIARCRRVLCLDFDDDDSVPDRAVLAIVQFAQSLRPGMCVLLHCRSNANRSTAAALILLREMGVGYKAAFNEVARLRPRAAPNSTMIRLYSELVTKAIASTGFDIQEWSSEEEEAEQSSGSSSSLPFLSTSIFFTPTPCMVERLEVSESSEEILVQ